jgi:hypothetical protein
MAADVAVIADLAGNSALLSRMGGGGSHAHKERARQNEKSCQLANTHSSILYIPDGSVLTHLG